MLTARKVPPFKQPKQTIVSYDTWRKGLNTLLRETEIDNAELAQADNLLLIGSGIPTKRYGSQNAFIAGATGYGRFIFPIKDATDNIQVLAMTDSGILVKQNGASYTPLTGISFASGYNLEATELNSTIYMVNGVAPWTRYDFNTLVSFPTLALPTAVTLTNVSGVSGLVAYSWRVTSVGVGGGETLATSPATLANLPLYLNQTSVLVKWTAPSAASGAIAGYNIYRGQIGLEQWVGGVASSQNSFVDQGQQMTQSINVPLADSSAGPTAKWIIRYKDRLILAGIPGYPNRVLISAEWPYQQNFDTFHTAGFIEIEPGSGEDIMGIGSYYNSAQSIQTLVVFKEHSVWEIQINTVQFGQYTILNPTYRLLTLSQGCASHRSITPVENDLLFVNSRGIYILRYTPQLLNVIEASEISAKIRPFFQGLQYNDIKQACGTYMDKKYWLAFPISKQIIAYDRERLCFLGPWKTPFGINQFAHYYDASGIEKWLAIDSTDGYVSQFSLSYPDDKGTPIITTLKTKKDYMNSWSLFKTVNEQYFNFANVTGQVQVNIYLEQRNGSTIVAKSLTIAGNNTGQSGFGSDGFGLSEFGTSQSAPGITSTEIPKRTFLFKSSRTIQIEIITTNSQDNYQLLNLRTIALPQSQGMVPSTWTI